MKTGTKEIYSLKNYIKSYFVKRKGKTMDGNNGFDNNYSQTNGGFDDSATQSYTQPDYSQPGNTQSSGFASQDYSSGAGYGYTDQSTGGYQNTPYYSYQDTAPQGNGKNVCGKLSFIFGIVSMCVSCCGGGLPFAIAALILGNIGKDSELNADKAAKGRTFGIIGIVLNVIFIIVWTVVRVALTLNDYNY